MDSELRRIIKKYLAQYPEETQVLEPFTRQMEQETSESITSRKNFTGHITASAFLVDPMHKTFYMLFHPTLGIFLQPGGHIEPSDSSLFEAAKREVIEETGFSHIEPIKDTDGNPVVVDIVVVPVPKNERKQEEEHFHYDIRFIFRLTDSNTIPSESHEEHVTKWVPLSEIAAYYPLSKGLNGKLTKYIKN